jgi:hypothetical protein
MRGRPRRARLVVAGTVAGAGPAGAAAGSAYRARLHAAGGSGAVRWTVSHGSLPSGLRLHPRSGRITGRPHRASVHRLRLKVSDRQLASTSAHRKLRLVVRRHR